MSQNQKNQEQAADHYITGVSESGLPPLFGSDFTKGNLNWKGLNDIDYEKVGRVLTCHLIIEHHINKLIELQAPNGFDFDEANLTFSQKVKLIKNDRALNKLGCYQGLIVINQLRNKYSHHIDAQISDSEIGILRSIIIKYQSKPDQPKRLSPQETDALVVIEAFMNLFCPYIAGYCSVIVDSDLATQAINKREPSNANKAKRL